MTTKAIFDAKTGKTVIRDMNPGELKAYEELKDRVQKEQNAEAEKQAKLESAKAKLTALGLDEDEVQAILGL